MAKKQIASVDAGNGITNAILNGKPIDFASVRAAVSGDSLGLGNGAIGELQYDYVNWYTNRYIVGDDVLRISRRALERHLGSNRYGNEFHHFLVAVALAKLGVKSGEVDLTLFAPPGLYNDVHQRLQERFEVNGGQVELQFRHDAKPRKWVYNRVTVWPEGLAMAANLLLNDKGQVVNEDLFEGDVLILDIGVYTLDAILLSDGNFNPELLQSATWENGGTNEHIRLPLLKLVKAASDDFTHMTVDDIDLALRSEDKILRAGGQEINLSKPLEKLEERYAEWIANNVIDGTHSGLKGIRLCIVGGGMAPRIDPFLRKWYTDKIFNRASNAIAQRYPPGFWNSWGGYKLAMMRETEGA